MGGGRGTPSNADPFERVGAKQVLRSFGRGLPMLRRYVVCYGAGMGAPVFGVASPSWERVALFFYLIGASGHLPLLALLHCANRRLVVQVGSSGVADMVKE